MWHEGWGVEIDFLAMGPKNSFSIMDCCFLFLFHYFKTLVIDLLGIVVLIC